MYHMQVTEALGQKQIRLDITAAVGSCFGKSISTISSHKDLYESISPGHLRSSQKDLHKIMLKPLTAFRLNLHNIFWTLSVQDDAL